MSGESRKKTAAERPGRAAETSENPSERPTSPETDRHQDGPVPDAPSSDGSTRDGDVSRSRAGPGSPVAAEGEARRAEGDGASSPGRRWPLARLLVVLVLGSAALGAWYWFRPRKESTGPLVLQGDVDVRQINLAFKVEGRIETLAVDEGDSVRRGEVLATLDKRYFEDELRLARARRDNQAAVLARLEHGSRPEEIAEAQDAVAERRATLENAQLVLQRREALLKRGSVTKEECDNARAAAREAAAKLRSAEEALRLAEIGPRQEDIDGARAQLRAEEATVVQAERRLADSDLIAPGDGVILTRARERGAIVAPGETVITLTLSTPVWVRTYVGEADLGRIRPDMPAGVRTDSAPGKVYRGRIGFISPTAEFTPKTVETRELRTDLVYRLRVVVDNPDGGLRQGMPVTVTIERAGAGGG